MILVGAMAAALRGTAQSLRQCGLFGESVEFLDMALRPSGIEDRWLIGEEVFRSSAALAGGGRPGWADSTEKGAGL
jgi:hypothetical protein